MTAMSGSYDRPTGPPAPLPPPSAPRGRVREAGYSAPYTGPHAAPRPHPGDVPVERTRAGGEHDETVHGGRSAGRDDFDTELRAHEGPSDNGRGRRRRQGSAVVPAGSVTSRSLTLVVAIMCFLACLTAGGVYMVNQAASAWLNDIASEVTVQVEPRDGIDTDATVRDVTALLVAQSGIKAVKPYTAEESSALVEPWLGKSDVLKSLPVPRLIAVEIEQGAAPDMDALRALVATRFKNATLDDHRYWQKQIRTVTRTLALGGLGILMLVGAATTAIIISATRSSMASNREIVEVLHLVGATDRYIAHEFERHFLRLGVKAGLVGAFFAMLVFMLLPWGMEMLGGNVVTMAEMRRLFGAGVMDLAGYGVLIVVVVVIAGLCMLTSRFGVYHILDQQH